MDDLNNFDKVLESINFQFHKSYNKIYLTDYQKEILDSYGFNVLKYRDVKELIFDLNAYLNSGEENQELESILFEIAEFDYYNNTIK